MKVMAILITGFRICWITHHFHQSKVSQVKIFAGHWQSSGYYSGRFKVPYQGLSTDKLMLLVGGTRFNVHPFHVFWTLMQKDTINSKGNCVENCTVCQKEHTARLSRSLILTQCQLLLENSVLQDVNFTTCTHSKKEKKIISSKNKDYNGIVAKSIHVTTIFAEKSAQLSSSVFFFFLRSKI